MTDGPCGLRSGQLRLTNFQLLSKEKSRLPDKKVARCCLTEALSTRLPRPGSLHREMLRCTMAATQRAVARIGQPRTLRRTFQAYS
jgi:hypothetical protein